MSEQARLDLLNRIEARRSSIEDYLVKARPRGRRLITAAVVSSAIAAVLTAGPALGGESFTEGVAKGLGLPTDAVVWRSLCLVALVVSVVAAITTNLARSRDAEHKIAAAESTNAELEGLRTLVEFGQIPFGDAVKQYQHYVTKVPWVDDRHPAPSDIRTVPAPRNPHPAMAPPHGPIRAGIRPNDGPAADYGTGWRADQPFPPR